MSALETKSDAPNQNSCTCHGARVRAVCARVRPYLKADHKRLAGLLHRIASQVADERTLTLVELTALTKDLSTASWKAHDLIHRARTGRGDDDDADVHFDERESKHMAWALDNVVQPESEDAFFELFARNVHRTRWRLPHFEPGLTRIYLEDHLDHILDLVKPDAIGQMVRGRDDKLTGEQLDAVVRRFVVPGEMDEARMSLLECFGVSIRSRLVDAMPDQAIAHDRFGFDDMDAFTTRLLRAEPTTRLRDIARGLSISASARDVAGVLTRMYIDTHPKYRHRPYLACARCECYVQSTAARGYFRGHFNPICSFCWREETDRADSRALLSGPVVFPFLERVRRSDPRRLIQLVGTLKAHFGDNESGESEE